MPSSVAAYPDGTSVAGPYINRIIDLPKEFQFRLVEYDDGGCDVNVQPCGVKRWELEYEGLSVADLTTLTDHFNTAKGKVNYSTFYHRREAATYSNVMYESFDIPKHIRYWSNACKVVLVAFV